MPPRRRAPRFGRRSNLANNQKKWRAKQSADHRKRDSKRRMLQERMSMYLKNFNYDADDAFLCRCWQHYYSIFWRFIDVGCVIFLNLFTQIYLFLCLIMICLIHLENTRVNDSGKVPCRRSSRISQRPFELKYNAIHGVWSINLLSTNILH